MNRAEPGRAGQWIVTALVGLVAVARLIFLYRLPDRLLVRYIPDDAYYYLVMGRNFAQTGRWTFDGVEPASGFHLLWGYLLAALYRMAPAINLQGIILVTGVVNIGCVTLAAWLAARTAARLYGDGATIGIAIVMLSALSLQWDVNLMETAPVLLASAAVLDLLCRTDEATSRWSAAAAVGLGLFGMLARSDFGMLPLCLFAMHFLMAKRGLSSRTMTRISAAVLAGSVLGLAVVLLHTHWISGEWAQSSALQKLLWSRQRGYSSRLVLSLLHRFFLPSENSGTISRRVEWIAATVAFGMLASLTAGLWKTISDGDPKRRALVFGVVGTILAYVVFYRFNSSELQNWYVANLEIPVALLAAGGGRWLVERQRVLSLTIAGLVCACGVWFSFEPPLTYQAALYGGGVYLKAHPELRPVGAWNSGIISYFGDGEVTNLDGLVNDRILPYSSAGTLATYVRQRDLKTVLDFRVWFSAGLSQRAGDANGELGRCVEEQMLMRANGEPDANNPVRIFMVKPQCRKAQVK